MDHITNLLGIKIPKPKEKEIKIQDEMSIEYFRQQDLSRERFDYDILVDIGIWPDDILIFLEVLRLAYADFISTYSFEAKIFDEPIRNIIWFMNQKRYNKLPWVAKYLRNGQYEIPDGYLNYMIAEDNCYMRELEDRKRSENETKHYYLFKAILDILDCSQPEDISFGDIKLSKDYEDKLRLYVCIYSLKITYCIVDDTCRLSLSTALSGEKKDINIGEFVGDMCADIDERVLPHLKIIQDRKIYNKFYILRDLLTYIQHVSVNFTYILKNKRDPTIITENTLNNNFARLNPSICFDKDTITRVESVFRYFLTIILDKHRKSTSILQNSSPEDVMKIESASLRSIDVPVYNIMSSSTPKIEKVFKTSPREDKHSPRVSSWTCEDACKISSPKTSGRRLSISKISEDVTTTSFVIDLSKLTPRSNKKDSHRKYSTDIITLTPRKNE